MSFNVDLYAIIPQPVKCLDLGKELKLVSANFSKVLVKAIRLKPLPIGTCISP